MSAYKFLPVYFLHQMQILDISDLKNLLEKGPIFEKMTQFGL
jgi:hypothetical protein